MFDVATPKPAQIAARAPALQRQCACGGSPGPDGECAACKARRLQRSSAGAALGVAPPIVHDVLRSSGRPLQPAVEREMGARYGHDFSRVRVHTDARAAASAEAVGALAYAVGRDIVFGAGRYAPASPDGQALIAHELAHVVQQRDAGALPGRLPIAAESGPEEREAARAAARPAAGSRVSLSRSPQAVQRITGPYIKQIAVHLAPKQSAELTWDGTPPASAPGSDSFTVSTGKGYGDPGDPPGTCSRSCCSDAAAQCAPPWNQPGKVGACCTYYGTGFWTGTPEPEHNGWLHWTPIQPYYSTRGIALHQHTDVTGQPIGHGCVRMDEDNAKRIADFSRGKATSVVIDGRAAPVACEPDRRCGSSAAVETQSADTRLAEATPIEGLEGELT